MCADLHLRSAAIRIFGKGEWSLRRNHSYFARTAVVHDEPSMPETGVTQEIIVDCPYCNHAWRADPRWIASPCPNCGQMVYRYMDPKHD